MFVGERSVQEIWTSCSDIWICFVKRHRLEKRQHRGNKKKKKKKKKKKTGESVYWVLGYATLHAQLVLLTNVFSKIKQILKEKLSLSCHRNVQTKKEFQQRNHIWMVSRKTTGIYTNKLSPLYLVRKNTMCLVTRPTSDLQTLNRYTRTVLGVLYVRSLKPQTSLSVFTPSIWFSLRFLIVHRVTKEYSYYTVQA